MYQSNEAAVKSYVCLNCNKSYVAKGSLIRHQRYECGKPPRFQCPYCKSNFPLQSNVWRHIKNSHPYSEIYCIDVITSSKLTRYQHL